MPSIAAPLLAELEQEAQTTRKLLERIPDDQLGWKPHQKSMSLGTLALHLATIPGAICQALVNDTLEIGSFDFPPAKTAAELVSALNESVATAKKVLGEFDDQKMMGNWKATKDGKDLMVMPRAAVVRYIVLNHGYHHRGQLSVYLRELNIPVPSIYGPSADENPFQ
jgi:uncharacterized damage-inducible protein DinB